jgi:hypothetical protein
MLRVLPLALAAALLCHCGGSGPKLHNLRCRADPCQDPEDPFKLLLAVDFEDPTGTLGGGELDLRVDGKTQTAVALRDMFTSQGISLDTAKGTLNIDDDVILSTIADGTNFRLSLIATNGKGQDSNEPSIDFRLHLGNGSP